MRDHSGQCLVQYLENIGPATEQSDWLILVIGPLNELSRVIIIVNNCNAIYVESILSQSMKLYVVFSVVIIKMWLEKKRNTGDNHCLVQFQYLGCSSFFFFHEAIDLV